MNESQQSVESVHKIPDVVDYLRQQQKSTVGLAAGSRGSKVIAIPRTSPSKIFMTISISSINLKTFFGEKICNTNP